MTLVPAPDVDELAQCVGCGLCLPHCPTYRVTHDERQSPRGRIALIREWIDAGATDATALEALDSCVQCRGCEPACPSGVRYGNLISATREAMNTTSVRPSFALRAGLRVLAYPRLLRAGSSVLAIAQRIRVVPRSLGLPRLEVRPAQLALPTHGKIETSIDIAALEDASPVWFFRGCVMDAWSRDVHVSTVKVLRAVGANPVQPGGVPRCCGALHHHSGLDHDARVMAARVMDMFPGDAPIVVNSAGCGAMLKEYGHFLGTPAAESFSARVVDVHEYLARPENLGRLREAVTRRLDTPVVVQDPCHLRHVQRVRGAVRAVLATIAETVDLPDDGLCCGAGGSYFLTHADMANDLRVRKEDHIGKAFNATGAQVVASANPGCAMHLGRGGVPIEHPMSLVAQCIGEFDDVVPSPSKLPDTTA